MLELIDPSDFKCLSMFLNSTFLSHHFSFFSFFYVSFYV